MNTQDFRRSACALAACTFLLTAVGCSATSGGGGGGYVAKDGTNGDVGLPGGNTADVSSGDAALQDTMAMDMQTGGTDVLTVEIVDNMDVQPDVKPDVKPDAKSDVKVDTGSSDTTAPGSCVATGTCDPVANTCTKTGEACDIAQDGSAGCFPPPNDVAAGGTCDNTNGPFCKGGYHCGPNATCQKFCCSAADCPSGKACTPVGVVQTDAIGLCDP